jgi:CRISPR-associated protein Cas2
VSVRTRYIVSYDIRNGKRLKAVFKALRGVGDHLQYSVFRCDLSDRERAQLVADLDVLIDHREDQVLLIDLGPADGRAGECIEALGVPYIPPSRRPVIV